jgi:hypothetical protein
MNLIISTWQNEKHDEWRDEKADEWRDEKSDEWRGEKSDEWRNEFWLISAKASSTQTGVSGIFLLALKLVFCLICSSVCPLSASSACLNSEEAPLTMMLNFCCFCSGVSLNQLLRVDLTVSLIVLS